MKTLVIIGAARPNGHTRKMVDLFLENLDGEKEIIDAYRMDVKPCMDCRYCWKTKACIIKDGCRIFIRRLRRRITFSWPPPCISTPSQGA